MKLERLLLMSAFAKVHYRPWPGSSIREPV